MVKPASDTVGFLKRQCQPHLLTGLLLTDEFQDFVKKNTRSNAIKNKTITYDNNCKLMILASLDSEYENHKC